MKEHAQATDSEAESYDAAALREKAMAAKDAVADLAGEVKNYAVDRFGKLRHGAGSRIKGVNDGVVEFVQDNPFKALAIAAGAGLLIGMLIKRR